MKAKRKYIVEKGNNKLKVVETENLDKQRNYQ